MMHVAFIVQCELTSRRMKQCSSSRMWQGYLLCFVFRFWRKRCKWFHWSQHDLIIWSIVEWEQRPNQMWFWVIMNFLGSMWKWGHTVEIIGDIPSLAMPILKKHYVLMLHMNIVWPIVNATVEIICQWRRQQFVCVGPSQKEIQWGVRLKH